MQVIKTEKELKKKKKKKNNENSELRLQQQHPFHKIQDTREIWSTFQSRVESKGTKKFNYLLLFDLTGISNKTVKYFHNKRRSIPLEFEGRETRRACHKLNSKMN